MKTLLVLLGWCLAGAALATNLYYDDITAVSPAGQYEVTAVSPDNAASKKQDRDPFQDEFTYTCRDTRSKAVLWTRKQPMKTDEIDGKPWRYATESSPSRIFVSDAGWTVIVTGRDELICVDVQGKERGKTSLLNSAFTEEERENYVGRTTAGPIWAGCSMWYFLEVDGKRYFVVRPWWGTRKVMNLDAGMLTAGGRLKEPEPVATAADAYERQHILTELKEAVKEEKESREKAKAGGELEMQRHGQRAAYLAGALKMKETVPLLRELEESEYSGCSSSTGGMMEIKTGEADPMTYSVLTLRQAAQLSLRRLGETPRALPVHLIEKKVNSKKRPYKAEYYKPPPLTAPRHTRASEVKPGMKAEEVLALIGAPDFIQGVAWEYDMDEAPGYSLTMKWKGQRVTEVEKGAPKWKEGEERDREVVR